MEDAIMITVYARPKREEFNEKVHDAKWFVTLSKQKP